MKKIAAIAVLLSLLSAMPAQAFYYDAKCMVRRESSKPAIWISPKAIPSASDTKTFSIRASIGRSKL